MTKNKNFEHCRKICKKHGRSYYFATKFFPKEQRLATYALYAFFRIPDEIVDNPKKNSSPKKELARWQNEWQKAYKTQKSTDPVLQATAETFHKYKIPYKYSEDFLKAMIQDTKKSRYHNYQELEKYMYGSAAVVGLMMSYIIGFNKKIALDHATDLGYAMQLTNFLRDIKEDYFLRNRIYMPLDELKQFNLTETDIKNQNYNKNFINFMQFQIDRTRRLYENSKKGIKYLNKHGRFAVKMAATLYSAILKEIEKMDYNIFNKRAYTTKSKKIWLSFKELLHV